ncbi:hypothetical protein HYV10_00810 [Candidatus Dependentiae bacterium]|nr:hypothetical protein [Candidatus Dependentiae bacterium]
MRKIVIVLSIFIIALSGCKRKCIEQERMCSRIDMEKIIDLIPKNSEAIQSLVQDTITNFKNVLSEIDVVCPYDRTYLNTVLAYEKAYFLFYMRLQILKLLSSLSDDIQIQLAANLGRQELEEFKNEHLVRNKHLHTAFSQYLELGHDPYHPTKPVQNFLKNAIKKGILQGIDLDLNKRVNLINLTLEMNKLSGQYNGNILHDIRHIVVEKDDLQGLDDSIIQNLHADGKGSYILPSDNNIFNEVMQNCSIESTRKNYFMMFGQIAYPQNDFILNKIIENRKEYANVLGYENFAQYQTQDLVFKNVKKIENFLWSLVKEFQVKNKKEYQKMFRHLPAGVSLSFDGKLKPWDDEYVKASYRKKFFNSNELEVSQYFPLSFVLPQLLRQLEKFFFIKFEAEESTVLWADKLISYRVRSMKNQAILGYIFFDLYAREGKKVNGSRTFMMIPAVRDDCSIACAGATVVAVQFKSELDNSEVLLKFKDIITLTHEIGQSLQNLFGATRFTVFSGASQQQDFVQVPAMVLEYFLEEPDIIMSLSHHYKTGKTLTREQIDKLVAGYKFGRAGRMLKLIYLSLLSLEFFKNRTKKVATQRITEFLYKKIFQYVEYDPSFHIEANFPDLVGDIGSIYYVYPVSRIIAADIFSYIKQHGLLNHETGEKYITDILSFGASAKPQYMIKRFLGHNFSAQPYFSML